MILQLKMKNLTSILLIFLVTCISICISNDNLEPDRDLEMYLREALENFRQQMKTGIEAIQMPVLDPLQLRDLDINVEENLATLELNIKKLNVKNLSLFNITLLDADLETFYLAINLTLPAIQVQGWYSTIGKLLKIFPIYGKGDFVLNATLVNIAGVSKLDFTKDTLYMSVLRLDFYWDQLIVHFENFLGDRNFSHVLQKVVAGVGKDVFLIYKSLILEQLERCLRDQINEKLDTQIVKNILKDIIPKY